MQTVERILAIRRAATSCPRRRLRHVALWGLLGAALGAALAFAVVPAARGEGSGTYPVKLFYPAKVGEKYELAVTATEKIHNSRTETGKPARNEDKSLSLQLEAEVEVLAVDHEGRQTKLACTVRKFSRSGDGAGEVLPVGAVVTADLSAGGPHFLLKGGSLTPQQGAELALVLEAHRPAAAMAGDLFGNAQPQAVGAAWPVNTAKAAADATREGMTVSREGLKGQAKLAGVRKVGGKDCVEVTAEFTEANAKVLMPAGVALEKATVAGKFSGVFPTEPGAVGYTETYDLRYETKGKGREIEPPPPVPKGSKKKPAPPKVIDIGIDAMTEIHREAKVTEAKGGEGKVAEGKATTRP